MTSLKRVGELFSARCEKRKAPNASKSGLQQHQVVIGRAYAGCRLNSRSVRRAGNMGGLIATNAVKRIGSSKNGQRRTSAVLASPSTSIGLAVRTR